MAITHEEAYEIIDLVKAQPRKWLFGIDAAIERSVMALFTLVPYTATGKKKFGQASVLLIDVPGVGKTDLIRSLSFALGADSVLIAGHPEMMKSEIIGTEVWNSGLGRFFLRKGPIFNHMILFDEINRTHPKGQSCFLQAMEERIAIMEVTDQESQSLNNVEFPLYPVYENSDDPDQDLFFWVMATANPIEQEGTYPLPEAQLDRFAFSFRIGLPPRDREKEIRMANVIDKKKKIEKVISLPQVLEIGRLITDSIETPELASEYIMRLIENSRPYFRGRKHGDKELYKFVDENVLIQEKSLGEGGGLSPRSNFAFEAGARTHAFFRKNKRVTVDDVKAMAHLVMDHRILLTPQAIGGGVTKHQVVERILEGTKVPPS